MAVGEDQAALRVDHEAGGLRGGVPFGVERARRIDFDGDDAVRDALERDRPVRIFFDGGGLLRDAAACCWPPPFAAAGCGGGEARRRQRSGCGGRMLLRRTGLLLQDGRRLRRRTARSAHAGRQRQ